MRLLCQTLQINRILSNQLIWLLLSVLIGLALGNSVFAETQLQTKHLKKTTLMLDSTPNANHVGLYVAKVKGYYQAAGVNVELLQSGKLSTSLMVGNQQVAFGISDQEELSMARAADIPIVSLAAIIIEEYVAALDNYTSILITHTETIQKEPELVRAVTIATQKGYEYAIAHPAEIAEILLKAAPKLDRALILESQAYLSPRYQGQQKIWGWQERSVFVRYNDWLLENGLIDVTLDADLMFTNQFLQDAN